MEVVAGLSSIIALSQLAAYLVIRAKCLRRSLEEISYRHTRLQDLAISIVESLELIENHIKDREDKIEAGGLRDSLATLLADLEHALRRCRKLSTPKSGLCRTLAVIFSLDHFNTIEMEVTRIERRIRYCHERFHAGGNVRIELSLAEVARIAQHIRTEMQDRFAHVEACIQGRVDEAEYDRTTARALTGVEHMSQPQIQTTVGMASLALDGPALSSLEHQYLRTMINTLTDFVSRTSLATDPKSGSRDMLEHIPSSLVYTTHIRPTGDPTHERQDTVMETLRVLRLLRSCDAIYLPLEDIAHDLERLSMALADIGMYGDSLQVCRHAVQIYRICASKRPDLFQVNLCWSLINLSASLGVLGYYDEALQSVQEAICMGRSLSNNETELSMALLDASIYFINLGRHEEAMQAIEEGLGIRRKLASEHPELYASDFAVSLSAASISLLLLGQCQEALRAAEEAVSILRELSKERPEQFLSMLAYSLDIMSHLLSQFLRFEDALGASQESVQIFRQLAQTRPEVFNGGLSLSLRALSVSFRGLKMYTSSLKAIEEAVDIQRLLVHDRPEYANAALASFLDQNGLCLIDLGRAEEALNISYEATHIFRSLIWQHSRVCDSHLADSLRTVSKCLSTLGRHREALQAVEESLDIYRDVSRNKRRFWAQGFGDSLAVASSCYGKLKRFPEAIDAVKRAVEMYKLVAEHRSEAFKRMVDRSLAVVSACLGDSERHEEALENAREAVDILTKLRSCPRGHVVAVWFAQSGATHRAPNAYEL